MASTAWHFEPLSAHTHAQTRQLILNGLEEHWGELDPAFNTDLDDMLTTYETGQTVVALLADRVIGTGTLLPDATGNLEIKRMSVAADQRRTGLGRAILAHLEELARAAGRKRVILETSTAWTEVVSFYLSCGYSITHTEDGEFDPGTWFEKRL